MSFDSAQAPADPGAFDLEPYRQRAREMWSKDGPEPLDDICGLIAAVEALRERVAEMLPYEKSCLKITAWCAEHGRSEITTETELLEALEAAEARVVGLAGLVQVLLDNDPDDDAADGVSVLDVWRKEARAALNATPEEVMERARIPRKYFERIILERGPIEQSHARANASLDKMAQLAGEALTNLDALKEEK